MSRELAGPPATAPVVALFSGTLDPMRVDGVVLGLAVTASACGVARPPVVWSGDNMEFSAARDGGACEGTYRLQDDFIALLSEFVGVSLDDRVLYVHVDPEDVGERCPEQAAGGCASGRTAVATRAFSRHELAHVVTLAAGWRGPSPFVEGVAEMFNDGVDPEESRTPLDEVLADFQITDAHYYTMGLFVRFLVERHGLDALAGFMRATDSRAERAAYESTFAAHFGEPLAEAVAAFEAYPTCPEWSNRIALYECSLPLQPWRDGALDVSADVDCRDPAVFGPLDNERGSLGAFAAFEIAAAGTYSVEVRSEVPGFAGVRVTRCGSCWDEVDFGVAAGELESAALPPGRYYATFVASAQAPGRIDLRVAPEL